MVMRVSNQMVSPASGDLLLNRSFHMSTDPFPIKWCHQRVVTFISGYITPIMPAIGFPIKWCHQRVVTV
mgnify:CR=1 FL=1